MKHRTTKSILLLSLIATMGMSQKKPAKVGYDFPKEMAEPIKKEYVKICDKGQILYNINCARCHNTIENKKSIIPDFTLEQLKGYELRISNAQHESSMPDTLVTAEELGQICTFLMYKKKNIVSAK